jgi:hypothetical protein
MPLGQPFTKSVARRPFPASDKHSPGQLSLGTEPVSPEHPVRGLYPTVMFAFSLRVIWETRATAFACAAAHDGLPGIGARNCQKITSQLELSRLYAMGKPGEIGHRNSCHL